MICVFEVEDFLCIVIVYLRYVFDGDVDVNIEVVFEENILFEK